MSLNASLVVGILSRLSSGGQTLTQSIALLPRGQQHSTLRVDGQLTDINMGHDSGTAIIAITSKHKL